MTPRRPLPRESEASRAVLVEVLQVLGAYREALCVIGGLVPELLLPARGHVGSLDVDLAFDARRVQPSAYASIRRCLLAAGYAQPAAGVGVFLRSVPGARTVTVKVDLVACEDRAASPMIPILVQDLRLGRLTGMDLAFDGSVTTTVRGRMPDGAENAVSARIVGLPAFLCLKAFALAERRKEKDAYDIAFVLRHCAEGPAELGRAARRIARLERGAEALSILAQKFETIESLGPRWNAEFCGAIGDDPAAAARDAYERAQVFLRAASEPEAK